ncbi:hypothetical protein FHX08_006293 [Rhizobium sp. BK529]|nr:hypothetical protein [Rhizobium sp. BK529]
MRIFGKRGKIVHPFEGAPALAGALTPGVLPVWSVKKKILRKNSAAEAAPRASSCAVSFTHNSQIISEPRQ